MLKIDKTKLELIRLEGIRSLIINKISKHELTNILKNDLKIDSKDCFESLKKLKRYQLIKIIEKSSKITSQDIENSYEQFRYGLKPGFTIFNFSKSNIDILNVESVTLEINSMLDKISYLEDAKFKNLKLKNMQKIKDNTYEVSFVYLSKYTYISEEDEPNYIYELKDCFVWINLDNNFIAIKNCPNDIQNKLLMCFSKTLNVSLYNIKITKKLIAEVFNGKIKKGTFIKPDAKEDEVAKITISDDELYKKKIYTDDVSSYDMSNTFLDEQLDDETNSTLGINCAAGKVYLTRNVNATQFRNWSIDSINKITCYLNDIQNCKESDIFKSRNIMANTKYSKETKNIIENICYNVFLHLSTGETSFLIKDNLVKINQLLKNKFYISFFGTCDICNEETQIYCNNCNKSNFKLVKDDILCLECGEKVSTLLCDEGHVINLSSIEKIIKLIPTNEFIDEINNLLFVNFGIKLDGAFTIDGNYLNIHRYTSGQMLDYSKIIDFKDICQTDISNFDEYLCKYKLIKEKCKKCNNSSCANCMTTNDLCIMKLFIGFGDYRPTPHQGQEFGDVNFEITYENGEKYNFVGIAKSRTSTGILNLSSKESREMIQQIITMSRDKRVDVIGAICPAKFHDQLKQELRYIANITKIKIVILDDIFMGKLLKYKTD